ncbi:MAG: hypothetical protein IKC35_03640 [Clostridia bacterium]|nr:hypothetical protein [Clostridia bacterium]
MKKNINPKGKKTGDCVVRALALATGREYLDVYSELFYISIKSGYIINDKRVEEKFLANHGFIKHKQPKKPNGKKYLVGEIDKLTNDDVIVISCAHHLTVALSGTIVDTWDCRGKCISNYFTLDK